MKTTFAVGNLGRDAEIKIIKEKQYFSFSLACNEGKNNTQWVTVLCESRNEQLLQYLTKGRPVAVVGRSTINAYIGKDGAAHAEETIWADKLTLVSQGGDKDKPQPRAEAPKAAAPEPTLEEQLGEPAGDDLPFD